MNVVDFFDRYVRVNELGQPFRLLPHQREILSLAFTFDSDGRLAWDTIVYSAVKKSGKTTINAAVTLWWAFTQEAPNEVNVLGNDLEQSQARTFSTIVRLIQNNPELRSSATVQAKQILFTNGTVLKALATDAPGEAGGNPGFNSWTELWGNTSEASRRMWEELTPVPTRRNSVRFVDTYAGFEGESQLLFELYKLGVDMAEHPEGQGERIHDTLPIYVNPEARLFCYWDHEPRMPWQTESYYASQRRSLRPNAYLRLHQNRWVSGTESFVDGAEWDLCVDPSLAPTPTTSDPLVLGVDAGIKGDTAAVVGVAWRYGRPILACHRIWRPTKANPIDLEDTIEAYLRERHRTANVRAIVCDPYQLHRSITTLRKDGLPIRELAQTSASTTQFGQALFDSIRGKSLGMYPSAELREQAMNAVALETARGWRLAKEKASKKIDAVVALAMAVHAATEESGHNRSVFAAIGPQTDPLKPDYSPQRNPQAREWWGWKHYGRDAGKHLPSGLRTLASMGIRAARQQQAEKDRAEREEFFAGIRRHEKDREGNK